MVTHQKQKPCLEKNSPVQTKTKTEKNKVYSATERHTQPGKSRKDSVLQTEISLNKFFIRTGLQNRQKETSDVFRNGLNVWVRLGLDKQQLGHILSSAGLDG